MRFLKLLNFKNNDELKIEKDFLDRLRCIIDAFCNYYKLDNNEKSHKVYFEGYEDEKIKIDNYVTMENNFIKKSNIKVFDNNDNLVYSFDSINYHNEKNFNNIEENSELYNYINELYNKALPLKIEKDKIKEEEKIKKQRYIECKHIIDALDNLFISPIDLKTGKIEEYDEYKIDDVYIKNKKVQYLIGNNIYGQRTIGYEITIGNTLLVFNCNKSKEEVDVYDHGNWEQIILRRSEIMNIYKSHIKDTYDQLKEIKDKEALRMKEERKKEEEKFNYMKTSHIEDIKLIRTKTNLKK